LLVQRLFERIAFGSPQGHAAEHLQSGGAIFLLTAMLVILIWALPPARRTAWVWLATAVVFVSLLPLTIGNYQVVAALRGTDYSDGNVWALASGIRGFAQGHSLTDWGKYPVYVAVTLLTLVLWRREAISRGVAIGAGSEELVFPPWIVPAFGVLIMAIAVSRRRATDLELAEPLSA
jgi:hypothetical protein